MGPQIANGPDRNPCGDFFEKADMPRLYEISKKGKFFCCRFHEYDLPSLP
jgi:hypothetical protein